MDSLIQDPFVSGIFLFVGLTCMILEVFVPTAGILGLVSAAATVFGVYSLFYQGHPIIGILVVFFFCGVFLALFKFVMHRLNFKGAMAPDTSTSVDHRIGDLIGHEGVTLMPLRPAGMALIDGKKVDVVSLGDFIEKDVAVRVVDNSGNRVVVRQVETRSATS
jgi:membrane-bound serine protease (ClpP class)